LRDESDRSGMRIAIELKRDVDAAKLLKELYRRTKLEETFGINMLALVDGGPHQLSIKRALNLFIEHRRGVITARTQFDLDEASSRLHVLEGLHRALGALDTVIALIRAAHSTEAAQKALVEQLSLTPTQARAILDMRLARLAALERKKIADELKAVTKQVRELEAILASPRRILNILIDELRDLKERFGDDRRTRIIADATDVPVSIEDLIPDQTTVVMLTEDGMLKRLDQFGGRPSAREVPLRYLRCNVRDMLLLFTAQGNVHGVHVHRINAVARRSERGVTIASLVDLRAGDRVVALVTAGQTPPPYLVMATVRGQVKRGALADYLAARAAPLAALRLDDGDELLAVEPANEGDEVLLHTRGGKAIRFPSEEIRPTGRVAGGVRGIRLDDGDAVLPGTLIARDGAVLTLTASGVGRRAPVADYPLQGRDGSGVRSMRLTDKTGPLVVALCVADQAMLEGVDGAGRAIVLEAREIPLQDRQRPGVVVAEGIKNAALLPRR
jgi:DNA gyrase subunit A